jgi:hypothetical protein
VLKTIKTVEITIPTSDDKEEDIFISGPLEDVNKAVTAIMEILYVRR